MPRSENELLQLQTQILVESSHLLILYTIDTDRQKKRGFTCLEYSYKKQFVFDML